jgi:hypothetical protein
LQTSLHQDYLFQDWSCQQAWSNAWDDSKLRYTFLKTLEELHLGIMTFAKQIS